MIHLRMKYFQQQKKTYQWGRGVAVMREDLFKMLDFLEEAVLICQVDKESTKKHLVLLADFLEQNYDWDPSSFSVHDLADRVDDFFLHTARVKDILATKAKIIEPYELYKAMNEVKAHKEVLICVMMSRLVNHAFSTVMPKTVSYQELYEEEMEVHKRTARYRGESAVALQRAEADAHRVFGGEDVGGAFEDNAQRWDTQEMRETERTENEENDNPNRGEKRKTTPSMPPPMPRTNAPKKPRCEWKFFSSSPCWLIKNSPLTQAFVNL
jgi:hypothetical protein